MSKSENPNTNAQNKGAMVKRQETNKAADRAEAEKTARFGGCKV